MRDRVAEARKAKRDQAIQRQADDAIDRFNKEWARLRGQYPHFAEHIPDYASAVDYLETADFNGLGDERLKKVEMLIGYLEKIGQGTFSYPDPHKREQDVGRKMSIFDIWFPHQG